MMHTRKASVKFLSATLLAALGMGLGRAVSVRAASATYYVATNGNDAWSGGSSTPWRTIQHAATASSAGDTIVVRGGTYNESVWMDIADSGTSSEPKTFTAFTGERVTLDGAWYPTAWAQPDPSFPIWYTNASGIDFGSEGQPRLVWQDEVPLQHADPANLVDGKWWYDTGTKYLYVRMRGGGDPTNHIAVQALQDAFTLNAASWIALDGFHIVHYFGGIEQLDTSGSATMEGLIVRNCLIEHVGEGIMLAGGDIGTYGITNNSLIENNTIQETQGDGIWVGTGIHHVVRGNTVSDVKQAWYRSSGIVLGNADNSVVERNQVSGVDALGIDIERFNSGAYGNGNIVRRNLVHDVTQNAIAILGANTTRVENNIIYNLHAPGILVNTEGGPATGNILVNNTVYHGSDHGISINAGPSSPGVVPDGTVIGNNIFDDLASAAIDDQGTNTGADYDLFSQQTDLDALHTAPQETNGTVGNPSFVSAGSDFRLSAGSPAIDKGSSTLGSSTLAPAEDFFGTSRPRGGAVDIGATEYDPPTTPTPTPTPTDTATSSPTSTETPSETMTGTLSPVVTPSPTPSATPTATDTSTTTLPSTPSATPTATDTSTTTLTSTPSATPTASPTTGGTSTTTPTSTLTPNPTSTPSTTLTPTITGSTTVTHTLTASPSPTPTRTRTRTPSRTPTRTRTRTRTKTPTYTVVLSATASPSPSATPSPTLSPSSTRTRTVLVTASDTHTPTLSPVGTTSISNASGFPQPTPSVTATSQASGSSILGTGLPSWLRDYRFVFFGIAVFLIISLAALVVWFLYLGFEQEGKNRKEK